MSAVTLEEFSEQHEGALFDAVALLDAVAERIDAATPSTSEDPEKSIAMHNTLRLVQMASERVKAATEALFNAG